MTMTTRGSVMPSPAVPNTMPPVAAAEPTNPSAYKYSDTNTPGAVKVTGVGDNTFGPGNDSVPDVATGNDNVPRSGVVSAGDHTAQPFGTNDLSGQCQPDHNSPAPATMGSHPTESPEGI